MESAGAPLPGAIAAPDLADVVGAEGPFASIYLTTEGSVDNAAQRSEQRWRTLRGELAEAGADEALLELVDPLVADAHSQGECLAVIGTAAGILHVEHGPAAPPQDVATWSSVPALAPLLRWRQEAPAYALVLIDREGADLVGVRHTGAEVTRTVEGDDGGGLAHRRDQQRAENTWEENADDVAAELAALVARVDARLVVVAGDVRAVQLLRDSLPKELDALVDVVEGGRSADGSDERVEEHARERIRGLVAADGAAISERLAEELGQHDRGVEGLTATLEALSMAQVDTLLVTEDLSDEQTAWFGSEAIPVADSAAPLADLGVEDAKEGRLVDVLVRAAIGTSARVRILAAGAGPKDGVGAILRWAQ